MVMCHEEEAEKKHTHTRTTYDKKGLLSFTTKTHNVSQGKTKGNPVGENEHEIVFLQSV